ncbi:EVE domain-containing protein [Flocculibacter collagenilyticus]|uniref:EVE domain-containing protein n=1 Tax=Flocculibacter collagenilyticus TaxID=2744479 RepID=UPI0018F37D62|nr:EVE domain-containing protein [Flocculibacter collagenilyticus]
MPYWLMKTEPDTFSIDDLANMPDQTTIWDGVRNYQARNYIRDKIKIDDNILIYHSSCRNIGIVGWATVVRDAYPDPTQFDPSSRYYDPKATEENPRWFSVDVKFNNKFNQLVSLATLKDIDGLKALPLVKKGSRLSVMPVSNSEWKIINALAN